MKWFWFSLVFLIFCNCVAREANTRDARVLRLAMSATVAADFLLVISDNPLYGLCMFCCVQAIYCYRYGGERLCGALLLLWTGLLPLMSSLSDVVAVGILYAVAFALSLSAAMCVGKKYAQPLFVALGMTLFACCDICVAVNYFFPGAAYPLLWFFYLPGQALLSVSGAEISSATALPFSSEERSLQRTPS